MRKLYLAAALATAFVLGSAPARADLDAVSAALGAGKLNGVQFQGNGLMYGFGQSFHPGLPWPKLNLLRYTRTDDYAHAGQSFDYTVTRADQLGGTAVPPRGEFRRAGGVVGDRAWAVNYPQTEAVATAPAPLQHDLWITPHGIVKAALADKAKMEGDSFTIEHAGKFKARATVDAQNLVVKVESWIDTPVLGDTPVVTLYSDYKDHNGIKFPGHIVQTLGGFPVLDLTVTEVAINPPPVAAPAEIATPPSVVTAQKAAEGVWFLAGGSHNSVLVEMKDYLILVESPLGDGRANAVIQKAKELVPGKPIRYVVATHHHFDHSGGLRAAAADGEIIVAHDITREFLEEAYKAPHTINPDALAKSGKTAKFENYGGDKYVLTDGARTLELHRLKNYIHVDGMMIGYLPQEKILIVADAFSPRVPVTATPAVISPGAQTLWDNIQRLKVDVKTVLPIHGRMVDVAELKTEVGAR